jgi:predicted permease
MRRRLHSLLYSLLPRDTVVHRDELDEQFEYCLRRERARLGRLGVPYAWARFTLDIAITSVLLRRDAFRLRQGSGGQGHLDTFGPRVTPGDSIMARLVEDLRYSLRVLRRAPLFSASVILVLALSIGASTSVFTVVNAVLLKSLPFADPDRLILVFEAIPGAQSGPIGFSAPDFRGFEQRVRGVESVAAYNTRPFELSAVDQPERVVALRASAALFQVLGVPPALGRTFTREEDEGRVPVVVLGDGLWRRKFGGDPSIVGRALQLDRRAYTVLGVMPRTFVFPNRGPVVGNQPANNQPADLYIPISFTDRELTGFASMYNNSVIARLAAGVTPGQADAEIRSIADNLVRDVYPAEFAGFKVAASSVPLRTETVGRVERLLQILFAAVVVVALIACADVASLMLTRALARSREIAVRSALGAGRAQVARQVLVEAALLSLVGGGLGLAIAYWTSLTIVRLAPPTIPRLHEVAVDWRVVVFVAGMSLLTAIACGLLPALELTRRQTGDALKEGGARATSGTRQRRMFGTLVAVQFALAIVLLVAGGLLVRSFAKLAAVDPGFRAEHVLTLPTSLPASAYPTGASIRSFYQRLFERVNTLPGLVAAGASTDLPLSVRERRAFDFESVPAASATVPRVIAHDWVLGRYAEALGLSVLRGRFLGDEDTATSEPVVVVNDAMARRFWPGEDPVGKRITFGPARPNSRWMRVVGIVADVKQGPLGTAVVAQTYTPWLQIADAYMAENVIGIFRSLKIIVRTQQDPMSVASALGGHVRALDASLPVAQVKTMTAVVEASLDPQRFNTMLLGGFAAVAVVLAAVGIGGVLSTVVSRRTQEIGVRLALGAQRADVLRMVIRQGMTLALCGLAIGVPAAFFATRFMEGLLFSVGPRDFLSFAGATAALLGVAFAACYLPARRATRVDPMVALILE